MSESSSEDENTERLKEAVWSFGPDVKISGKDNDSSGRPSQRAEVSKHDHDGNELGTTPEFRSHVSKKLGAILDGCISETVDSNPGQLKNREEEEDEDGFRLFSTSVPGKWMEQSPPPPPKKRPIPSSSDSDSEMEMRFREAAVSVSDLLFHSSQPPTEKTEKKSGETEGEREDGGTIDRVPKKKKKRKKATEASEQEIDVSEKQSNGGEADDCQVVVENLPKKKKKKKKRKILKDRGNSIVEC